MTLLRRKSETYTSEYFVNVLARGYTAAVACKEAVCGTFRLQQETHPWEGAMVMACQNALGRRGLKSVGFRMLSPRRGLYHS